MVALGGTSLVGVTVGQVIPVSWATAQAPATLRQMEYGVHDHISLYNESGCGLNIQLNNTGRSFTLPAGGWTQDPIPVAYRGTNDTGLTATVLYIISNAQISQLFVDYFVAGDIPLRMGTLGNSPIGGTVQVANSPTIVFPPTTPLTNILVTTQVTAASFSIPASAGGLYMIDGSFIVANGGASSITVLTQFTSLFNAAVNTRTMAQQNGATLSSAALANGTYGLLPATFYCRGGTTITVFFQDATNTPDDSIVVGIVQMF